MINDPNAIDDVVIANLKQRARRKNWVWKKMGSPDHHAEGSISEVSRWVWEKHDACVDPPAHKCAR